MKPLTITQMAEVLQEKIAIAESYASLLQYNEAYQNCKDAIAECEAVLANLNDWKSSLEYEVLDEDNDEEPYWNK